MDVYVVDDGTKNLSVAGYVLHNSEATATVPTEYSTNTPASKTDGFTNTYTSHDLTINKVVSGNQASRDEYFKLTVVISDAVAGTVYDVDLTDADATTGTNAINTTAHTNPASITVPAGETSVSTEFWLQGGQSIVIKGLANNTGYTITEDKTALDNEGYAASLSANTGDTKNGNDESAPAIAMAADTTIADTDITADTAITITNTKSGTIPTGVMMAVAPFAVATLIGGAGVATMTMKKRKKEDE